MAGEFVAGSIVSKLLLNTTQFKTASSEVTSRMGKIGNSARALGSTLTRSVTLPIAGLATGAVIAFGKFDAAMTESTAIMGDLSTTMREDMVAAAKEMAEKSIFRADELAEAYFFLASAGLDAKGSIEALPVVTKFAQAGMFDLSTATDLLTDAQSALGLTIAGDPIKNMQNMVTVSDTLVRANTLANASVLQFSEALTNRAATASAAFGISMTNTVSVLAAFADRGVKGRLAGMRFSIMLTNLTTAAQNNEAAFRSLNIEVFDPVTKQVRDFADIIKDLENALGDMDPEMKNAALSTLGFNEKTKVSILSLIGASDQIRKYKDELDNASGFTDQVASKQMESFTNQMKLLRNQVFNVAIEFGQELIPIIKDVVETGIKPAVKWFKDLDSSQKNLIVKIALVVAALGPLVSIFGRLLIILPKLITPIGLITTGLAFIAKKSIDARRDFIKFSDAVKERAEVSGEKVSGLRRVWDGLNLTILKYTQGVKIADAATEEITKQTEEIRKKQAEYGKEVFDSFKKTGQYESAIGKAKEALIKFGLIKDRTKDVKDFGAITETASEKVDDFAFALEKEGIKSAKEYAIEIEKLRAKQDLLNRAFSADEINLIEYEKQTKSVKSALAELTGATEEQEKKTRTWIDFLKDKGILTVEQKIDAATNLDEVMADLNKKYEDGTIDLEAYTIAMKAAKKESLETGLVIDTQLIPVAEDFNSIIGLAPEKFGEMDEAARLSLESIRTTTSTETGTIKSLWDQMADGLQTKWASTIGEVLSGATSLRDGLKGIWGSIKQQFFDMIGQMIAKWTTNFVSNILSGAQTAGSSITSNVTSAIQNVGSGIKNVGQIATSFLTGGAIGGVIGGILGGIFGGSGEKGVLEAIERLLQAIWENTQVVRNFTESAIVPILDDIKFAGWDRGFKLDAIKKANEDQNKLLLEQIQLQRDTIATIQNKKSMQAGGIVTQPGLAFLHGTQSNPEIVLNEQDFGSLIRGLEARPRGNGNGGTVNLNMKFEINNQVDPNFTKRHVEEEVMPVIENALKSNRLLSEFQTALGIA